MIPKHLDCVSAERIRRDLYYLCCDPLPFRKVNYTRPGQTRHSLAEAEDYILGELRAAGLEVTKTMHRVQAFRCDSSKPLHHWYSAPAPEDPFYDAANLEAVKPGQSQPEEIIQLISHKDSMSWIDSPGTHDNASGTVANLELARVLAALPLQRTVRILFCNEEHTPWTSRFAAEAAAARQDRIIAVLNVDSLDGKSDADMAAGVMTHAIGYSTDAGKEMAAMQLHLALRYTPQLQTNVFYKRFVNDDDGMFIKAGFANTVMHLGSWPYGDAEYHLPGDTFARANIDNLAMSTRLILACVLTLDKQGFHPGTTTA
jgi:hypothetical protein